ncbi:hypothetical protein ACMFMG_005467 [Clarireedia jacksonii]
MAVLRNCVPSKAGRKWFSTCKSKEGKRRWRGASAPDGSPPTTYGKTHGEMRCCRNNLVDTRSVQATERQSTERPSTADFGKARGVYTLVLPYKVGQNGSAGKGSRDEEYEEIDLEARVVVV